MKSNFEKLLINSGIYTISNYLVLGLGFISLIVFAYYLPPDELGILGISRSIGTGIQMILSLGLGAAAFNFYFRYEKDEELLKSFYGSLVIFLLFISTISLVFFEIFGKILLHSLLNRDIFHPYIQITLWSSYLYISFHVTLLAILKAKEQSLSYTLFYSGTSMFSTLLSLVFVVYFSQGVTGILMASFICYIIFTFFGLFYFKKLSKFSFDFSLIKKALLFGFPLIPHFFNYWFLSMISALILSQYVELSEVGVFTVSSTLASGYIAIIMGIDSAFVPAFAKFGENQQEASTFPKVITLYSFLIIFVYLIITVIYEGIYYYFLPDFYQQGLTIIYLISTAYLIYGFHFIPMNIISYTARKTKYVGMLSLVITLFSIFIFTNLIRFQGIHGAAFAMIISFGLLFLFFFILSIRVYPIKFENLRIIKLLFAFFIVMIIKAVIFMKRQIFLFLFLNLVIMVLFIVLLLVSRFLTKKELETLIDFKNIIFWKW